MILKATLGIDEVPEQRKSLAKAQDGNKTRWIHWASLVILVTFTLLLSPWWTSLPVFITATLAISTPFICILFWIHGIRNAGKGIRRVLFLSAFSASLSFLLVSGTHFEDVASGFKAGYEAGSNKAHPSRPKLSQNTHAETSPIKDATKSDAGSSTARLILTLFTYALLSKLERNRTEKEEQAHHHQAEIALQQEQLRDAKDSALRAKLAPHFIFNALNTLKAQIKRDPENAVLTTDRLATLFRQVLELSDQATIPLSQELAFVEAYLGIEQSRFGSRLKVQMNIPEELESAQIPPLSLQVLVENAVKHGVSPLEEGGTVSIGARMQTEKHLEIWVEDPGSGVSTQRGTGTALATLKKRLATPTDLLMQKLQDRHRVSFIWSQA